MNQIKNLWPLFLMSCAGTLFGQAGQLGDAADLVQKSGVQGGLIVHVGATDLTRTAQLRVNDRYLVQALTHDEQIVQAWRQELRQQGRLGPVSVRAWSGGGLPFADKLVNLLIVHEEQTVSAAEISRVLAPHGVALIGSDESWRRERKAWPDKIDQWTHFLHGPDNNAVANDTEVAPPHYLQWSVGPRWGRSHDQLGGVSAAVSAAGRIFYIVDEGNVASVQDPAKWMLVARDAFNGILLWKRPLTQWENHLRPFRSGPAGLPRRLVAEGSRVYVTLGYGQPITVLDAATGEELANYPETTDAREMILVDGKLFVVVGKQPDRARRMRAPELPEWLVPYPQYVHLFPPKHVVCIDATSGTVIWRRKDAETTYLLPLTMATDGERLYFQNEKALVALDASTGDTTWTADRPISLHRYAWSTPTVVVSDGVVLSGDRTADEKMKLDDAPEGSRPDRPKYLISSGHDLYDGEIIAFSAKTGERLWSVPCHENFNAPVDVFVARGQVWSGQVAWTPQPGIAEVYDLHTGEVVARRPPDSEFGRFGHHRCYRAKATVNYVLHSRRGIEFVDMDSDQLHVDRWLRGTCQYGILPCNGMIYTPPHACACYVTHQLNSFNALVASRDPGPVDATPRIIRGPAASKAGQHAKGSDPRARDNNLHDWPMYRRDASRSGVTQTPIAAELASGWKTSLGPTLTQPIVAAGKIFTAQSQTHAVHALSSRTGEQIWDYCAGAPVDSPPTYHRGFLYFGAADGCVYCLNASDGTLVWRRQVAPESRQIVSYGHLESAWPTQGSLLVRAHDAGDPVVYGVAGRSTYVDGGMVLYGLQASTGEPVLERRLYCASPESAAKTQRPKEGTYKVNVLPDVLSTDGEYLFMRNQAFDLDGKPVSKKIEHLFSSAGYLDDSWWHRTYWQFGADMGSGYGGWITAGNRRVSARLMVQSQDRLYGFGRRGYEKSGSHARAGARYHLFSIKTPPPAVPDATRRRSAQEEPRKFDYDWSVEIPFFGRALLLADDKLCVAGPERIGDLQATSADGESWLWIVKAGDGQRLSSYKLPAPPVFDSLATDGKSLYLTTVDGHVICYDSP